MERGKVPLRNAGQGSIDPLPSPDCHEQWAREQVVGLSDEVAFVFFFASAIWGMSPGRCV